MQNSHKTLSKRTRIKPFDLPCFTKSIIYLLISESFSAYDQQKSLFNKKACFLEGETGLWT